MTNVKMIIERDQPVEMEDGVTLRADVFRPQTKEHVPVIMTHGPYGKGVRYQDAHFKDAWEWLSNVHPELLPGSTRSYLTWETVDPELWVSWGYAVIRVDSRGAGRSPGYLDILSPRETRDYYEAIEWAGQQPWCNGKVGLNGISYYAVNQWHVAALAPPHLHAMIPWEGAADMYRDWFRHGGILANVFALFWYELQIKSVQHGNPTSPLDPWLNERCSGPAVLSETELAVQRADNLENAVAREMDDEWYGSRSPDWSKVQVPFLSAASWAGFGLHPRGNFEAFTQAASKEKWLECHPGRHEEWFYLDDCMALQRRFFDYYLKGESNGWIEEPRVRLNLRKPFTNTYPVRFEEGWPLPDTRWTRLYVDADAEQLSWQALENPGMTSFNAMSDSVTWRSKPLERETELTGPMALKCFVSSTTVDADIFVTVQAFSADGREVHFQGSVDPETPLAQGWLRASHRKLDIKKSLPYRPFHSHDEKQPLRPGDIYELDIEIWPQSIILPAGYVLAVNIGGKDFEREPAEGTIYRGSGPWLHNDPRDRPENIFGGTTTIYSGAKHQSYLLIPVIPPR